MPGYHLHQSSNLETFLQQSPHVFMQDDPFSMPVNIIVQNRALGDWLNHRLAEECGAVMGPRTQMPEMALRTLARGYPAVRRFLDDGAAPRKLLFPDGMMLVVYKTLEEALAGDEDAFAGLRRYVEGGSGQRLWQLSDTLAHIFYQYGMNCTSLVDAWERGRSFSDLPDRLCEEEVWQRLLWQRMFREDAPHAHLSRVLSIAASSPEVYDGPPARIVIFGSMFLGETALRFFRHLAESLEVHHFQLQPSRSFSPGSAANLPFLRNNGILAAGFAQFLPELHLENITEQEASGAGDSLLHRLRASLIKDVPFTGRPEDDGSLAFHDVVGLRREVEVLKDRLLEAFRDDVTLRPTQIAVLAPNISRYAPYLESIFPSRDRSRHIPFNLFHRSIESESPYLAALALLIELPGSRFGRGTLMKLFANPCFGPGVRETDDAEDWERIIEELNIRWGVDEKHRLDAGAADGCTGSWEMAFDRLLAAYYHSEGDDDSLLPASLPSDAAADAAGVLMRSVRGLNTTFRFMSQKTHTLKDWTLIWEKAVNRWLIPRFREEESGEDGSGHFRKTISYLLSLDEQVSGLAQFPQRQLPWAAYRALLEETLDSAAGGGGGGRGVFCASVKTLRSVPFRRIYILGLNEGEWPARETPASFDLREAVPKVIDLSQESADRFAFLEILFSATDHISVFYQGRDSLRGETLEVAAPARELLQHLGDGTESLIQHHPLAPYDPIALSGSGPLATFSRAALRMAESRRKPSQSAPSTLRPLVPANAEDATVDWSLLVRFLRNPVKHFYQRVLGAEVEEGAPDWKEEDVLEAEFLQWWNWRSTAVLTSPGLLKQPEELMGAFQRKLTLEGAAIDTPIRDLQARKWNEDAESLASQLERMKREGLNMEPAFSCRFDPSLSRGNPLKKPEPGEVVDLPAPCLFPAGAAPLTVVGKVDGIRFLQGREGMDSEVWTLTDFASSRTFLASHNLRGWTAALLIFAALGDEAPREIRVFRFGTRDQKARRYFRLQEDMEDNSGESVLLRDAEAVLTSLVRVYRDGERAPLALYPELADALYKIERKTPMGSRLPLEALGAWNTILASSSYSKMNTCAWRSRYLNAPLFDDPAFRRAWESLYLKGGVL